MKKFFMNFVGLMILACGSQTFAQELKVILHFSNWTSCTSECGDGIQVRKITCVDQSGEEHDLLMCHQYRTNQMTEDRASGRLTVRDSASGLGKKVYFESQICNANLCQKPTS